jgi:uncharacterized protein YndB with AHSA1/START domain
VQAASKIPGDRPSVHTGPGTNSTWQRRLTLLAVCIAQGMILLDVTIVNIALPSIQRELHASSGELEWVISGYALSLAALIPLSGSLGDRFGRRRFFAAGMVVFTLGTVACALSAAAPELIATRVLAGALGTGRRLAAEQAFSHGYQVAVFIAGLGLIAAAIIAAFGLRGNRRRDLDAAAGKPAASGDRNNPAIVALRYTTRSSHNLMEGTVMSIIEDVQRRSAHIHWPQGIVPEQADLFAHNDIVIAAPPQRIWEHLIRATAWPDWYSNASGVTVNASSGLLGVGVTFDWITFGAHIHSTVHEFEPAARIGWYGETDQWLAYHTWLLEPRDEGTTYVVMEETGSGLNPRKLARSNPGHMHRGHDLWNISLKFLCESTQD